MNSQKWNLKSLLETSGNYWNTCVLHAAVKLQIFTIIGDNARGPEQIAQDCNGDARAVTMFLDALVAMELLSKEEGKYRNTSVSKQYLSKESDDYRGYIIMHQHYLMHSWVQLDKAIISGGPVSPVVGERTEVELESFLMGMFNIAMDIAPLVVKEIDLSKRKHLLDLGGGPGTYAIHFCKKNPHLKATVCDLPTTRPFAQKTIERFELADRINFQDVDFLNQDIPGTYDVAWLSHILHGEGPQEAAMIIQKAVSALEPGGLIFIHEFILNNTMDGPMWPAVFSLNMLLGTSKGKSYSEEQLSKMLSACGVKEIKRIIFPSPNDSSILMGVV